MKRNLQFEERGLGDASPPEDEQMIECQSCCHVFDEDDSKWRGIEVRCPSCDNNNVRLYP